MNTGAIRRAAGLTLLYCGIFVALVLVQFSGSPGLSLKIGAFSMNASYPKASQGRAAPGNAVPDKVRLSYAGLAFEISPKSPALGVAADGTAVPLSLLSVSKIPNGASVKLSSGVEIKASVVPGQAERFTLSASAGDGLQSLRLKLVSSQGISFASSGDKRSMLSSGKTYDLALGSGVIDQGSGLLTLAVGDSGLAFTAIEPPKPVKPAPTPAASGTAKLASQAPKDADAFKAEVAAWRDKVWTGLSSVRLDPDKLAWKGPDGTPAFSEKALAAYIAEAANRGSYSDAVNRAKAAKDKYPDKIGALTAPYLGSLYRKMTAQDAADQAEATRLAQLVADKSPALFEKEGLLRFLLDRGPTSLSRDAFVYVAAVDQSKLSMRQAVGYLSCAVEAKTLLKDEENPFVAATVSSAADRIAAAVRKTASGLFLATDDDGGSDLRASLLAGEALIAYGQSAAKPNLLGLGQGLVEGMISVADAQGFSPSRVVVDKGGAIAQKAGSILPEDFYPILADNPYYPHEVSFARESGAGAWAWTCAPTLTLQSSPSRKVFSAGFIAGRTHFIAIYGIKRFANIQLYDIDYSPDNDFESYDASGYRHDIDKGVLYLKMKHKKDSEDIKLSF
jgi:hypothetical protein